jgi:4-hydroxy-4-methyl-2-oxoglutarate aldolase
VNSSLAQLGSATVHEAYGGRGALPCAIKPVWPGARVLGRAFTVACAPADNLWLHRAIYAASPGDVLVVDVGGQIEAGYWGELMSYAAQRRHLGGLVIDGGVRDVERITALGFAVFAAAICIRGTTKAAGHAGSIGDVVQIGEVRVATGDTVLGDADGVVVVSAAELSAVAQAARARAEHEREILHRLAEGASTLELLGLRASPE